MNEKIASNNHKFIKDMYIRYLSDDKSIQAEWSDFFSDPSNIVDLDNDSYPSWFVQDNLSKVEPTKSKKSDLHVNNDLAIKCLIDAYRRYGYIAASLNPLYKSSPPDNVLMLLDPSHYGLNDPNQVVKWNNSAISISDIHNHYKNLYTKSIGFEFNNAPLEEILWLESRYESLLHNYTTDHTSAKILLESHWFESFVERKFQGVKRFSIAGGEAAIMIVDAIIRTAASNNVSDVYIGMPHRGRINVFANIMDRSYEEIFYEFHNIAVAYDPTSHGSGDVKYHNGCKSQKLIGDHKINVELIPNPSHLEAVNPIVAGYTRAAQDRSIEAMSLLLHGDSAFAGQGIVYEMFNMAKLPAYDVGGTLHLIVNNQLGFTADFYDSYSGNHCTDIAKIINAPVLHLCGADIDACRIASQLAVEYRQKFRKDIILDLICYRKYGHSETDEPKYTQPQMYAIIDNIDSVAIQYTNNLQKASNGINSTMIDKWQKDYMHYMQNALNAAIERFKDNKDTKYQYISHHVDDSAETAIDASLYDQMMEKILEIPNHVTVHPKLLKVIEGRKQKHLDGIIDLSSAELLAFAYVLHHGASMRLVGEDVERGTFSSRHAIITDQNNGQKHNILSQFTKDHKSICYIHNSALSEYYALGFEYGYSLVAKKSITIWEAQYGDFANGAIIIFDQFISSALSKWGLLSNLIMLLPHGFDGQGPEHSSARLERYLQACASNNIVVANCTTPANYFHILCRQIMMQHQRPLILMTHKSILRHPMAVSNKSSLINGTKFMPMIGEILSLSKDSIKVIIITSGKFFYDLYAHRDSLQIKDVAILRIEQYYPFPSDEIHREVAHYKNVKHVIWAQEEPMNMGAWFFVKDYIKSAVALALPHLSLQNSTTSTNGVTKVHDNNIVAICRSASAATATGFIARHNAEQELLCAMALQFNNDI